MTWLHATVILVAISQLIVSYLIVSLYTRIAQVYIMINQLQRSIILLNEAIIGVES